MSETVYQAVARWDYTPDEDEPRGYAYREFDTLAAAKQFAVAKAGHDREALIKVYEGYYDFEDEWVEQRDYYYWTDIGHWDDELV